MLSVGRTNSQVDDLGFFRTDSIKGNEIFQTKG